MLPLLLVPLLLASGWAQEAAGRPYSRGGCLITSSAPALVNVTCDCGQFILQNPSSSAPIDRLTILGCEDTSAGGPVRTLSLLGPVDGQSLQDGDFLLLDVRWLNVSGQRLTLLPTSGRPAAQQHPLQQLHIQHSVFNYGFPDGALQGLGNLRHITLHKVDVRSLKPGCLADLPNLSSLRISDSSFLIVKERALIRTPRLRQFHLVNSQLQLVNEQAFSVENTDEQCGVGEASAKLPLSAPHPTASALALFNNSILTASYSAFQVSGVRQLLLVGNNISEALSECVSVKFSAQPCGADGPLVQISGNSIIYLRPGALQLENLGPEERPGQLAVAANTFRHRVFGPDMLRLTGAFRRFSAEPGPDGRPWDLDQPPSRLPCTECNVTDTRQLLQAPFNATAAGSPQQALFSDLIWTARCAEQPDTTFLQFAELCEPADSLRQKLTELRAERRVGPPGRDSALSAAVSAPLLLVLLATLLHG